jgi:hypothetical protein
LLADLVTALKRQLTIVIIDQAGAIERRLDGLELSDRLGRRRDLDGCLRGGTRLAVAEPDACFHVISVNKEYHPLIEHRKSGGVHATCCADVRG